MESLKNNFIWVPSKANLLLVVPRPEIPESIVAYAEKHSMVEKPEFHVSIIARANGKRIMEKFGDDEAMMTMIKSAADEFSWNVEYLQKYSLLEKFYDHEGVSRSGYQNVPEHMRRTLIQGVMVPDMVRFYESLSHITGIAFDLPFTHVTLFSWSDYAPMMTTGIGLYSHEDFLKYKKEDL